MAPPEQRGADRGAEERADRDAQPVPTIGNRASLIRFAAWAVATDRSEALAASGRLTAEDGVPARLGVSVSTFRRRVREELRHESAPSGHPHPGLPEETLARILSLVRDIERVRETDTLVYLARRFLGLSDDQLVAAIPEEWWPRVRLLDRWRDPADVLIAAEAAINYIRAGHELTATDLTGLTNTLRMLAVLLAGGHGSSNQAVARTAVLLWQLWSHAPEQTDLVLDGFADAVVEHPGSNHALRALDRAVRSHHDSSDFVQRIVKLYDRIAKEDKPLDAWLPGSYATRLIRVLGQYGDDRIREKCVTDLAAYALSAENTFTNRRACTWALLETLETPHGWETWRQVSAQVAAEDSDRPCPEFDALVALAPPHADHEEVIERLRRSGARPTDRAHLDLVNARVGYDVSGHAPAKDELRLTVPDQVADLLDEALPHKDEKLRKQPSWRQQTAAIRRSARSLLLECLLTPSVIRADTAVETLLAAGPSVRLGSSSTVERIFGRAFAAVGDPQPQWFLERVLSLVGFSQLHALLPDLMRIGSDSRRNAYLRARAVLVAGDLSARMPDPRAGSAATGRPPRTITSSATDEMRRLLTAPDTPEPVQVAAVRSLGLARSSEDHELIVDLSQAASNVEPSVRRMAAWADETLKNPFR